MTDIHLDLLSLQTKCLSILRGMSIGRVALCLVIRRHLDV